MLKKDLRDAITAQALQEIEFARQYKQGKVGNWKTNEDLYYGRKRKSQDSRANVDLGQMSSFVHTILSKIDNSLVFKFTKRKDSQIKRVEMLNRLRAIDADRDHWDIKDLAGKKQAVIYGRAIYSYSAESVDGYKPHLENVDVYDFLIDPSAGGINLENAMYMGRYGVVKQKHEIKKGIKKGVYLRTEGNELLDGQGNSTEITQEETNKQNRTFSQNVWNSQKEIGNPDKYIFWEWYTTYKGKRYYLLLSETGAKAIRIEPLKNIFESNLFPFWSWAAFLDLTEFWTPSYCDYVREIFMAQAVSINQMLDNAEQINKPMRVVNVGAFENLAELVKYRKNGIIKVKSNFNADQAYQTISTPSIKTPIDVFGLLESIQEKASGVTAGAKGVADEDKVGIYEGNQANAADRFGLLNKTYSFGYKCFGRLWECGVKEHLVKRIAIDIMGPDGLEIKEIRRSDLFRKGDDYGINIESSNAEMTMSTFSKRAKIAFLNSQATNDVQNPKKAYEMQAAIAGFNEEEIRQLMDKTEFGDAGLMSEAERDIEDILDGKNISPNQAATTAYKQRFVDYMIEHQEDLDDDDFARLSNYAASLDNIIARNMIRMANDKLMRQQLAMMGDQSSNEGPTRTPKLQEDGLPIEGGQVIENI